MIVKNIILALSLLMISKSIRADGPSYNFYFNTEASHSKTESKEELKTIKPSEPEPSTKNDKKTVSIKKAEMKSSHFPYSNWGVSYKLYHTKIRENSIVDPVDANFHRISLKYYLNKNVSILGFYNTGSGLNYSSLYQSKITGFGLGVTAIHDFFIGKFEHRFDISKNKAVSISPYNDGLIDELEFMNEEGADGLSNINSDVSYTMIDYSFGPKFFLNHFELGLGMTLSYVQHHFKSREFNAEVGGSAEVSGPDFQTGFYANAAYRF